MNYACIIKLRNKKYSILILAPTGKAWLPLVFNYDIEADARGFARYMGYEVMPRSQAESLDLTVPLISKARIV